MSNAGAIKGGGVFVEIGADPRKFFATLNKVNKAMGDMGRSLAGAGAKIGGIGVATLAPFAAAVREGSAYQSTLLNIQASAGVTAQELDRLKTASMQMSQAMGVGPTQIANSFLELLKAGMTVEQVLAGAGQAAIEFATVGQMDVAEAGVVMADAMKVFGVTADIAANAISSAADASSTSIEGMSQAFSQVSAVAALANQSIGDTSAALAILANAGVKGSDAGTSLKTMLMRLMSPADEAVGALASIGLSVQSFRNADGSMKPLVDIIGVLNGALAGLDQAAKDDIFRQIFGSDAIRSAAILTGTGVDGFSAMTGAMDAAMPVGEKFKVMMSGLAGAAASVMAALQRFAIAVSDAVGPALMSAAKPVMGFIDGLTDLASKNNEAVATIAKFGVSAVAIGGALTGLGLSLQVASFGFGGILKAVGLVAAPLNAVASLASFVGMSFYKAIAGVLAFSTKSVAAAVASGAAWVTANAPLLVLLGLLGAAGAAAIYAAGGFSGIADAIGGGLNQAAADGMIVLSDLATTATTTFSGIYAAITQGDLAGAMDVLWAGLHAGWLRGVEALMGYVDPWIATFQNVFTYAGTEIAVVWENMWTGLSATANTIGAALTGAFDNIINGVLKAWDSLEAGILKSWNYIQSFFKKGFDLKKENEKVDSKMAARARERELARPGVAGRMATAAAENEAAAGESQARVDAMRAGADATAQGRFDENARLAEERRAATMGAEATLNDLVRGQAETRARGQQVDDLGGSIANVGSLDGLRGLADELHTLKAMGRLTSEQESKLAEALDSATERLMGEGATIDPAEKAQQGAGGAGVGGPSQAEVAGTFSSVALGGMGFGSSLAQKQVDLLGKIESNTRVGDEGLVGA
jgi:TP901 family phage tail tape measure protein